MKLTATLLIRRLALLVFALIYWGVPSLAQISSNPAMPLETEPVTITFNATGTPLEGYQGTLYAHTGVNIKDGANWQHVIGSWGNNDTQPFLTKIDDDLYELEITPSIREFYSVPENQNIAAMAFVFRAASNAPQSSDLFVTVYEPTLSVTITNPPARSPIMEYGKTLNIEVSALLSNEITLSIDDTEVASTTESTLEYLFDSEVYGYGTFSLEATASDGVNTVVDHSYIYVRPEPVVAELPQGVIQGINYIDDETVTLVLHDPPAKKEYVFVIGDFNNWMPSEDYYMNVTPEGDYFWLTMTDLVPQQEYGFQYFIDNELRLADPYTDKVLDPGTDNQIIQEGRYPGLIPYPYNLTENPASVIQTAREPYQWQVTDFTPPAVEDLVIYELLIRDFLENNTYAQLSDTLHYLKRLGINAIELMPVTNFEGNLSWGYNPSFFFAPDKFYGSRRELKKLIDEAHSLGMAVIVDIVWNHSFSQSPLLQMYFDGQNNRPSDDNPWYSDPIFQNPGMNFGYKFDHGSQYFVDFMDRANAHWMEEYKVDGFRFDLTKGFTTQFKGPDDEWGSKYDQERVDNLIRMYNHIKGINPEAYVILEHLADNVEEKVLADAGMLLWGNMNHNYNEATMGWHESNKSNLSWGSYQARNWNDPHLITYMESHDEERLMHKNLLWGNSAGNYDITDLAIALRRIELAAAFFFTIPGPKMIWQFGELGYDISIDYNGRVGVKPVLWDYYDDWRRKRVYNIFAALIELKKEHDVFRTTDYNLSVGGVMKRINLNHASNNVTVIGNFGVTEREINPAFQQTGTWHEFFSRETLDVTDVSAPLILQPGEYRLYSTVAFDDHGLALGESNPAELSTSAVSVFPNPSNSGFHFNLEASSQYNIRIVNMQGQTIFEQQNVINPDQNAFFWNGSLSNGNMANTGVYFYNIFSAEQSHTGKIMLR